MPSPNSSSGTRKRKRSRSRSTSGTRSRSSRSNSGRCEYEKSRANVERIIESSELSYIHNLQGLVSGVYGEIVDTHTPGQIVSYDTFNSNIANENANAMAQHVSSLSEDKKRSIYLFLSNIRKYDKDLARMLGTGWNAVEKDEKDEKTIAIVNANRNILQNLNQDSVKAGDSAIAIFRSVFVIFVRPLNTYGIKINTNTDIKNYYKNHFTESDKARFLKILSEKNIDTTSFGKNFAVSKAKKQKYI